MLFLTAPPQCIPTNSVWQATFKTNFGDIVETMSAAASFQAVNNFVFLARYHYFDGTDFLRVIQGFVVQGGAVQTPTRTGPRQGHFEYGYPGYQFTGNTPPASCSTKPTGPGCYRPGDLAMANSGAARATGANSSSSCRVARPAVAAYTLFGHIVSGLSVIEKIGSYGTPSSATATGIPSSPSTC